ncbi:hypothetical protein LWI28_008854 [Acer negundo]|uniref:Reverse transcriptase domain-containing protein n=1 Tax=Acer negundo TaxID=4023 RepID=A0AAD5J3J0_ACENE|nr:hypothetical protein LWI28_008854 [Acer negundo]
MKCRGVLFSLSIDNVISDDQTVIRDHIVKFYKDLFSSDPAQIDQDLSIIDGIIQSSVSHKENSLLVSIPSTDVIHDAVFTMDAFSTPGLNSNFITLILKIRDSITVNQFRPIVLNFLFKISSKILVDMLAQVAARIVSPQQFGFIRDRHIEDCITLASDCVNLLHKKCYVG